MLPKHTILSLVVQFLVILSFSVYFLYYSPIYTYEENFDYAGNIFGEHKSTSYSQTLRNGYFIIENNLTATCLLNRSPLINFPANYTLTAKHYQKEGFSNNFGVVLTSDSLNYVSFLVNKKGETTIEVYENGLRSKLDIIEVFSFKHHSYNQIIKVIDKKYAYYIDDKLVKEDSLPLFRFRKIGFKVCSFNTVALDKVSIKDDDKNDIIFEENFNDYDEQKKQSIAKDWNIKEQLTYSTTSNNIFLINNLDKNTCLKQTAFLPNIRKNSHWSLSVDIKWIDSIFSYSQEFGLSYIRNNGFEESKVEFRLNRNGYASFKLFNDYGYQNPIIDEKSKIDFELKGGKTYHLKIEQVSKEKLAFYVNGEKIMEKLLYYQPMRKIGLVTCGKQVVEVDNVKYEEYRL